jgi:hypothetical protein
MRGGKKLSYALPRPMAGIEIELAGSTANNLATTAELFFMNEWNIQSRAHVCEACQQPFADKQVYHTLLFDVPPELRRSDVCEACWQKQAAVTTDPGLISRWQGTYEAAPPVVEAIQKETAETLLKKLIELNDPRYIPAGFILAVMLERKRILKVKEQIIRDGKRTFIYEQPKTGDVFTITDPDLHLNQLEAVQHDVAHLLEHGLTPPPAAEVPAVSAGASESPAPDSEAAPAVENEPTPAPTLN